MVVSEWAEVVLRALLSDESARLEGASSWEHGWLVGAMIAFTPYPADTVVRLGLSIPISAPDTLSHIKEYRELSAYDAAMYVACVFNLPEDEAVQYVQAHGTSAAVAAFISTIHAISKDDATERVRLYDLFSSVYACRIIDICTGMMAGVLLSRSLTTKWPTGRECLRRFSRLLLPLTTQMETVTKTPDVLFRDAELFTQTSWLVFQCMSPRYSDIRVDLSDSELAAACTTIRAFVHHLSHDPSNGMWDNHIMLLLRTLETAVLNGEGRGCILKDNDPEMQFWVGALVALCDVSHECSASRDLVGLTAIVIRGVGLYKCESVDISWTDPRDYVRDTVRRILFDIRYVKRLLFF